MKKFIKGKMINLAEPRLGSKVIFKTDDFFASANRKSIQTHQSLKMEFLINMENGWMDGKLGEEEERVMII